MNHEGDPFTRGQTEAEKTGHEGPKARANPAVAGWRSPSSPHDFRGKEGRAPIPSPEI
jgi:hypothetical protein